jgi:hypothetical protein
VSRTSSQPTFRNVYTADQFSKEILCGNLSAEWVRDQVAAGKIKSVAQRPVLISQVEAMRFLGMETAATAAR